MLRSTASKGMWVGRATVFLVGLAIIMALSSMVSPAWAPPAPHNTFTVTNTNDSGAGSLRQAIIDANDTPGHNTIVFGGSASLPATINLQSPLPELWSYMGGSLNIDGPGAHRLTVRKPPFDANNDPLRFRIFTVAPGATVSIEGLTIRDGWNYDLQMGSPPEPGGGILNPATSTLTITNSIVSDNKSNDDTAGGIYNAGTLTVEGSTVCNNFSSSSGGGIYNAGGGVLTVTHSLVCSNQSFGGYGSGIFNAGTLTAEDSTFSGNNRGPTCSPTMYGLVIHNAGEAANADIRSATITANEFPCPDDERDRSVAVFNEGTLDKMVLTNTIVARNHPTGLPEREATMYTDGGFNLIGGDPKLGALQDNDGPTKTHLPLTGSPALDQGNSQGTTPTDQ